MKDYLLESHVFQVQTGSNREIYSLVPRPPPAFQRCTRKQQGLVSKIMSMTLLTEDCREIYLGEEYMHIRVTKTLSTHIANSQYIGPKYLLSSVVLSF